MAGSNITCRLFAAFERFKNPNLIRLAKYLPAYKGKIGLAVCCMLTAGLSHRLLRPFWGGSPMLAFISSRLGWCLRLRSG